MPKRFVSLYFRHLRADWYVNRYPELATVPFVIVRKDHGRLMIIEANGLAQAANIRKGMVAADAQVILPGITIMDEIPELEEKLLRKLAHWCIRFSPCVGLHEGAIIIDASGCAHLWQSEENYLLAIGKKLKALGYHVQLGMADTIGVAWAAAINAKAWKIIEPCCGLAYMESLPPAALRLCTATVERLHKLGLHQNRLFMHMKRTVLRRRFGEEILKRIDQATGKETEYFLPVIPVEPFTERLSAFEPVSTRGGIETALGKLLAALCGHLKKEGKGLRKATFKCWRIDDKTCEISINTNLPTHSEEHLFKLFEIKLGQIAPGLGIELFELTAGNVEKALARQDKFWESTSALQSREVAELLDNISSKFGKDCVQRYIPQQHHLPERALAPVHDLAAPAESTWLNDKQRPLRLLQKPIRILVTAPIPDYPPMNFRYENKLHTVKKADACERIEAEWWHEPGLHRDYYMVEDEAGKRFWLYRLGHYNDHIKPNWYLHGFFA